MVALQGDYSSMPARCILSGIRELDVTHDTDGLALLLDWDGTLDADSAAAAVVEVCIGATCGLRC
jgi:penicillin amidase